VSQATPRTFGPVIDVRRPRAPAHLSSAAKRWWRSIVEEFDLEPHHVQVLTAAAEAFDRKEEARRILAEEGIVLRNENGARVAHPAVRIEDLAAVRMAGLIRELGLDGAPGPEGRER